MYSTSLGKLSSKIVSLSLEIGAILVLGILIVRMSNAALAVSGIFFCGLIVTEAVPSFCKYLPLRLFGLSLPIVPMLGSPVVLCLALLLVLFYSKHIAYEKVVWALPYLFVCAVWVLVEVVISFDWISLQILYDGANSVFPAGLLQIVQWMRAAPPHYILSIESFARVVLLVLMYALFQKESEIRTAFFKGLLAGLCIALVVTAFQIVGVRPEYFHNQNSYWSALGRSVGTFSDPNAFGIFIVLLIPLILECARRTRERKSQIALQSLALGWLVLGTFSGSRSFILGIIIYLLIALWLKGRRVFLGGAVAAIGLLLAINIGAIYFPLQSSSFSHYLPIGIVRVLESLTWQNAYAALYSRIVFSKIALALWLDNSISGVGFNNFRAHVVPYALAQQGDTGLWTDNANNFYLGVLAELGIIGIVMLFWSISRLRSNSLNEVLTLPSKQVILCLAVLLIVGPHLDFDEVAMLVAFILSVAFTVKSTTTFSPPMYANFVLIAMLIFFKGLSFEYGFYPWEQDSSGFFRWSGRTARGVLQCSDSGAGILTVRATNPDITQLPLTITAASLFGGQKTLTLHSSDKVKIEFPCRNVPSGSAVPSILPYVLTTSRPWVPQRYGLGADPRLLGLQVFNAPKNIVISND